MRHRPPCADPASDGHDGAWRGERQAPELSPNARPADLGRLCNCGKDT